MSHVLDLLPQPTELLVADLVLIVVSGELLHPSLELNLNLLQALLGAAHFLRIQSQHLYSLLQVPNCVACNKMTALVFRVIHSLQSSLAT